jgi:hypothetical protein
VEVVADAQVREGIRGWLLGLETVGHDIFELVAAS